MKSRLALAAMLVLLGAGAAPYGRARDAGDSAWPGKSWRTSIPEEQGVDSRQLAAVFDLVRSKRIPVHSVTLIRNGFVVFDADFYPYSSETPHDLASMTKSVVATLTGIAADRGLLTLEQPVLAMFPGRTFANTDDRKRRLAVEHLLTMTSGLCENTIRGEEQVDQQRRSADWLQFALDRPLVSDPGERFAYCSEASNVLSAVLTRATGMSADAFARRYLFQPLGITDVIWPKDPQGNGHGWGDTYMRPADMARIGYLYLKNGTWAGRQIVSSAFIREATREHAKTGPREGYGYKWWLAASPERFEARGRGGQRIVVIPSMQVVLVTTGTARFEPGDIGAILLPAIHTEATLPRNAEAFRSLMQKVAEAKQPPPPIDPGPLPARARAVNERTMTFSENPYGLKTVRLTFDGHGRRGVLRYSFVEPMNRHGATLDTPFRLDGVYAMSNTSLVHNLPTGARGRWTTADDFDLELNMAGFNHVFRLVFHFAAMPQTVQFIDESLFETTLTLQGQS